MKAPFYTDPANLRVIGKNFVLRRTKQSVGINLPPVNKTNYVVDWKNVKEMNLAEEIHALLPNQTFVSGSKRRKLAECFGRAGVLVALQRAKQSCILPSLMRRNLELFANLGWIRPDSLEALNYSSKLDAVIQMMIDRKDNGKGKIVFCHYQSEIDIIADRLLEGGMQKVVRYDGRNSGGNNLATLAEPADALVIQIQTGCEGLNLQNNFAEIYFVSPHWNPCVEDQAIARCHRIGQTKPVDVFKFEMSGFTKDPKSEYAPITLEKYVNKIQNVKRDISKQIFDETRDI
jgi:SNF2 family DNA or RNA helicase